MYTVSSILFIFIYIISTLRLSNQEECPREIAVTGEGLLTSVNYPDPYPANLDCNYTLTAQPGQCIAIHFIILDLQICYHPQCNCDSITLIDGTLDKTIGKYCIKPYSDPLPSTNRLIINFRSDATLQFEGFRLRYSTAPCLEKSDKPKESTKSIVTTTQPDLVVANASNQEPTDSDTTDGSTQELSNLNATEVPSLEPGPVLIASVEAVDSNGTKLGPDITIVSSIDVINSSVSCTKPADSVPKSAKPLWGFCMPFNNNCNSQCGENSCNSSICVLFACYCINCSS